MDKLLVFLVIFCVCVLIETESKPTEHNFNITHNLGFSNYKYNTNARALRLKNEGTKLKVKPIRPIKPCALIGGDCTEDDLYVVLQLEEQRRFGDDAKFLRNKPDVLNHTKSGFVEVEEN